MKHKYIKRAACAILLANTIISHAFADDERNFVYFHCDTENKNGDVVYSRISNLYTYQHHGNKGKFMDNRKVKAIFDDLPYEPDTGLHLTKQGKIKCSSNLENDESIGNSLYYFASSFSNASGGRSRSPYDVLDGFHKKSKFLAGRKNLRELRIEPLIKHPPQNYKSMGFDASTGGKIIRLTTVVDL